MFADIVQYGAARSSPTGRNWSMPNGLVVPCKCYLPHNGTTKSSQKPYKCAHFPDVNIHLTFNPSAITNKPTLTEIPNYRN